MKKSWGIALLLLLLGAIPHLGNATEDIEGKIQALKTPNLSEDKKWEISREIQSAGKQAIPGLIGCVKNSPKLADHCQLLLYNIITPLYTSPYTTRISAAQNLPTYFVIPNWGKWWKKQQNKSLDKIHDEARKKIDEFWLQNHKKSIVWK